MLHALWKSKGYSVVEIIISAAIIAVIVTGVATAWQYYLRFTGESTRMSQAALLTEEGAEAVLYLRDKSWASNIGNLGLNSKYFLIWNGSDYTTTLTPTLINNQYYRTISLASVKRDNITANISDSGSDDPGTKLVTLSIYPASTTVSAILETQMLIHNEFNN